MSPSTVTIAGGRRLAMGELISMRHPFWGYSNDRKLQLNNWSSQGLCVKPKGHKRKNHKTIPILVTGLSLPIDFTQNFEFPFAAYTTAKLRIPAPPPPPPKKKSGERFWLGKRTRVQIWLRCFNILWKLQTQKVVWCWPLPFRHTTWKKKEKKKTTIASGGLFCFTVRDWKELWVGTGGGPQGEKDMDSMP